MRSGPSKAVVGDWNALCDRCGFKFKASELYRTWDGYYVDRECWEPRHPQDFVRGIPDDSSVPWSRLDHVVDDNITYVDDANTTLDDNSDTMQVYNTDLTANRTVTLDTGPFGQSDRGKRFQVFRTGGGDFSLDVGGLQTIPSGQKGEVTVEWTGAQWQLINYKRHGL